MCGRIFKPLGAIRRFLGGVRVRLTLWYLLVIAIVFLIFSFVVAGTLQHEAEASEQSMLLSTADQLASTYNAASCTLNFDYPWIPGTKLPAQAAVRKGYILNFDDVAVLFNANGTPCCRTYGPIGADGVATLWARVQNDPRGIGDLRFVGLPIITPGGDVDLAPYAVYTVRLGGSGAQSPLLVVASRWVPGQAVQALIPGLLIAVPLTLLLAAL